MPSSMEELERTLVQLWEARRLARLKDVPHVRLALLLLDNASETSLMRTAKHYLGWSEMLARLKGMGAPIHGDKRMLSRAERRSVERNFDALVEYVFAQDDCPLDPVYAHCLKAIHRYRNAAYHRDLVRPDVLGPAVSISFFLSCHLLKSEKALWEKIDQPSNAISAILSDLTDAPYDHINRPSELGSVISDCLLADAGLDHGGISTALHDHLLARLDDLKEKLDAIQDFMGLPDLNATLRLVEVWSKDPDATPPEDFWTRPVKFSGETLEVWRARALAVKSTTLGLEALRGFDEVERELEEIEQPAEVLDLQIDALIQSEIDRRLGK